MRPLAPAAATTLSHLSSPFSSKEPQTLSASTPTCDHQSCSRWRPNSDSRDFGDDAAIIIFLLFSFLVCAMSLGAALRCFLRGGGSDPPNRFPQTEQEAEQRKPSFEKVLAPTLVYSAGVKISGAERECAICLSEFVKGEEIQVLGTCNHGFHVQCIQHWLSSSFSCPLCRSNILSSFPVLE